MDFKYRRACAVYRKIDSIDPIKDIRVRLLGTVANKSNNSITLEDDSGNIEILMDSEVVNSLKLGEMLRIFCRVIQNDSGFELRSEIIQDMNNIDKELYQKVFFK